METTPNLGLRLLVQSQSQKEITVNEALCRLDALQAGVISRSITPPLTPTDGISYIVASGATGSWSGKHGHIAYYIAGWHFISPREGMNLWVNDEAITYRYNGSDWVKNQSLTPGSLGIVNLTSPQTGDVLSYRSGQWENTPLAANRRNHLINAAFTIWQRGTSFTSPNANYTADRFLSSSGTAGACIVSRQSFALGQTDVPGDAMYFLRHQQTSNASTAPTLAQRIEGVRSLAGNGITLSFYAKANAALTLTPQLTQNFGTGGSPSAPVSQSLPSQTIGTSWARYSIQATLASISGKTAGSNGNDYLQLQLALPTSSTFTLDIAQIQLEASESATAFEIRSFGEDLLACRRYFYKTFAYPQTPATAAGRAGALSATAVGTGSYGVNINFRFPVSMRATPSIILFSPDTANNVIYAATGGLEITSISSNANTEGVVIVSNQAVAAGSICYVHATADAEL